MAWVFIMIVIALMAGFVQGVTGFGSGIVMMIFLPHMLPIEQSAGVSTLTMLVANAMIVWRYRTYIRWKKLIAPFFIYILMAFFSLFISKYLPGPTLKMLLGILLVVLSIYYLVMNLRSIEVSTIPLFVMVLFAVISGFFNGLFGIGGPLMALYFLTISNSKEDYLASIQTFFLVDTVIMTSMRFANGIMTMHTLQYVLMGIIGAVIGTIIANRLVKYINMHIMTMSIYIFIGISGIYYLLTAL